MKVRKVVYQAEDIAAARELVICELKDLVWREFWRSEIDIPGLKVEVKQAAEGFIVTASIERVPGEDCGGPDRGQRTG